MYLSILRILFVQLVTTSGKVQMVGAGVHAVAAYCVENDFNKYDIFEFENADAGAVIRTTGCILLLGIYFIEFQSSVFFRVIFFFPFPPRWLA